MRRTLVTGSVVLVLAAGLFLSIGNRPPIHASPAPVEPMGGFGGPAEEPLEAGAVVHLAAKPMSPEATKLWLKLQQKVDMPFPNETPLEDVVKYIEQATIDKQTFPDGISVYVDPQGLQDAEKTMSSTITINLKGIPLATTLTLLLKQIGLEYHIQKDGILFITSINSEDSPADPDKLILDNLSALRAEVKALREEVRLLHWRGGMGDSGPLRGPVESKPTGGMSTKGGMM
jgi:hypothetical protein